MKTLMDAKVGDRIIVTRTEFGRERDIPETVQSVTQKRIQAGHSWRSLWFNRESGVCVVGAMHGIRFSARVPRDGELEAYEPRNDLVGTQRTFVGRRSRYTRPASLIAWPRRSTSVTKPWRPCPSGRCAGLRRSSVGSTMCARTGAIK